jgi:hypothetical protein
MKLWILILVLLTAGCAGTFEEAKLAGSKLGAPQSSPERCASLSDAEALWSSVARGSAVVGAGAALTPLHDEVRDDKTGRIVAASVAATGATVAGFSAYLSSRKGAQYVEECR